ncbi:uL15m family ribosomal protein [Salinarchaeum chitinilyticum]
MTSKKRRQRGSRTHGGGTHKNRRGAGHRGGRGRAGRDKHEFHNYEPLGKHGFSRPQSVQEEILEINASKLDEDAALYAADGLAEETDGGYEIDAREVVEDGFEADAVKVLGGGQVRGELTVVADAFSASARGLIEEAGGEAVLSDRGEAAAEEADAEDEAATESEDVSPESAGE